MRKILLLNPPADGIYIRDYYRGKVSKGHYYYHPLDLAYLSGRFSPDNFETYLIDAIADGCSEKKTLLRIRSINPDIILSLISSPSYSRDINFLKSVKSALNCQMIVTGDICRDLHDKIIANSFIDAILLNFSTNDIVKYLNGESGVIPNVVYRKNNEIISGRETHNQEVFDAPLPRWDLFPLDKYSFPFSKKRKVASILTDFGCPYQCSFCSINTLGFKLRPVNSVIEEIELLKRNGLDEFFVRDQSFGANHDRTMELCRKIIEKDLNISWACFSRVDIIKKDLIKMMKQAGVHTIIFGIESGNDNILEKYGKNISCEQIKEAIELCRENRVRTVGTFIIGLPGESRESILRTIKLAKGLKLDYASFNVAAPAFGSRLRAEALSKNWVDRNNVEMDSAKGTPLWKNQELSNEEISKLHRRALISFYLDPRYLIKRLLAIRNLGEIGRAVREAKSIFLD